MRRCSGSGQVRAGCAARLTTSFSPGLLRCARVKNVFVFSIDKSSFAVSVGRLYGEEGEMPHERGNRVDFGGQAGDDAGKGHPAQEVCVAHSVFALATGASLPACTAARALRRCSRAAWHAPFALLTVISSSFTSTSTPSSSSARGRPQRKSERERPFAAAATAPAPARCAERAERTECAWRFECAWHACHARAAR